MATQAVIWDPKLDWIRGCEELTTYQATPGYHRTFCSHCGSRLINYPDNMAFVSLSINSVDSLQEGLLPSMHVYVGSKPALFSICDSLPQHALLPSEGD